MSAHEDSNEIAAFLDDLGDRLADVDVDNLTEQKIHSWLDEIERARIRIDAFKSKWGGDRWRTYVAPHWAPISVKKAALKNRLDQLGRGQESRRFTISTVAVYGLLLVAIITLAIPRCTSNDSQEPQKDEAIIEQQSPVESAPIPKAHSRFKTYAYNVYDM